MTPELEQRYEETRREGRAICNAYARARGWPNFDTAYDAGAITYTEVILSIGGPKSMPGKSDPSGYDLGHLQTDLGLSAKEFNPSAEALARARRELGLDVEPEPEVKEA